MSNQADDPVESAPTGMQPKFDSTAFRRSTEVSTAAASAPAGTPPAGLHVASEQDALRHAAQRIADLTEAVAARDQFIAVVGHELRNSVAPLILLADHFEKLVQGTPDPNLPSRVVILTKHLHKFVSTIDRVTEVANLRDGKFELEITCVDMVAEVAEAASRMKDQAFAGGVEIVIDAPESINGWWDRVRVQQIVSNLLSNAIRYGGSGRVEITVRRSGQNAELEVRDHGPGVPDHDIPMVFDRFDRTFPRKSGGFGMGLFVIKALAKAMGGDVSVDNARDGGACFRVFLPRG